MRRWIVVAVGCLLTWAGAGVLSASALARPALRSAVTPFSGKHRISAGVAYSSNWSGYAAYGRKFKRATGTFVVPTANCSAVHGHQETDAAFWAGLDGYLPTSGSVEQTGVEAICVGTQAYYLPWYEFYPAGLVVIQQPVKPDDTMVATVSHNSTTVTAKLTDVTRGWSNSAHTSAAGLAFSSAEWITEGLTHPTLPLTDFGSVHFGSASATDGANQTGTISSKAWKHDRIIQVDNNSTIDATPTKLSGGGSAFDVVWNSF